MDKVIRRIIEVENEARSIIAQSEKENQALSSEVAAEAKKIESQFENNLKAQIGEEERRLSSDVGEKQKEIEKQYHAHLNSLENSFKDKDEWSEKIFNDIVREVI